jgi:hypothetical protein
LSGTALMLLARILSRKILTTRHIATPQRIIETSSTGEVLSVCTAGICFDVIGLNYERIPGAEVSSIVADFPRLDMKRKMTACFCSIARDHPETTYDNFVRDFGELFGSVSRRSGHWGPLR